MAHNSTNTSVHFSATASSLLDWGLVAADSLTQPKTDLVLQPGQPEDLYLLLKNQSDRTLDVYLSLRGDFPPEWFTPPDVWLASAQSYGQFDTHIFKVSPQQTLYKSLNFSLPADFFEHPQALANQDKLSLQYASELFLYQILADDEIVEGSEVSEINAVQIVGHQPFQLYARPTRTYLDFLPEIYQQSDFLARFLSITEQALEPTYEATESFWAYLNPLTAPKALIPFLAHWVAWPLNPHWTLRQQRRIIRHAVEIYQWRGTRRGLQLCLHLCTDLPLDDEHIEITESNEAGFTLSEGTRLGDAPRLGGGVSYHFSVVLRPDTPEQANVLDAAMIKEMIEQEKPAFCTYSLTIVACP